MQRESFDSSETGFTPHRPRVNVSSLGLKYTGRTVMVSTSSSVPGMFRGWGRVAQEPLSMALALLASSLISINLCLASRKLQPILAAQHLLALCGAMHSELCTNTRVMGSLGEKPEEAAGIELTLSDQWFPLPPPPLPPVFAFKMQDASF